METKLNVVVLSHTPEFEQNIVRGARLCYSSANIEELRDKVTPEDAEKFLNMILGLGHGSVLEHSSITFGIEGVSRSLTHQLVRHRIASYSQKSQRYVKEGQFSYIIPKEIKNCPSAEKIFIEAMEDDQIAYNKITEKLLNKYLLELDHEPSKKEKAALEKKAIENARYILPNACETKIQVTMNVRALFNFFKERLCDRAQEEIRDMAYAMWIECMKISKTIFKHAVPSCVNGKCKEGAMCCGKMEHYKRKHKDFRYVYKITQEECISISMEELKPGDIILMFEPDNKTPILIDGEEVLRVTEVLDIGKFNVEPITELEKIGLKAIKQ